MVLTLPTPIMGYTWATSSPVKFPPRARLLAAWPVTTQVGIPYYVRQCILVVGADKILGQIRHWGVLVLTLLLCINPFTSCLKSLLDNTAMSSFGAPN